MTATDHYALILAALPSPKACAAGAKPAPIRSLEGAVGVGSGFLLGYPTADRVRPWCRCSECEHLRRYTLKLTPRHQRQHFTGLVVDMPCKVCDGTGWAETRRGDDMPCEACEGGHNDGWPCASCGHYFQWNHGNNCERCESCAECGQCFNPLAPGTFDDYCPTCAPACAARDGNADLYAQAIASRPIRDSKGAT